MAGSEIRTVGVVGGGQLGRMLALAGLPLGFHFIFLDPAADACARHLGRHLCAPFDDAEALAELGARSDVITFEFENAPARAVAEAVGNTPTWPPAEALNTARDRLFEKTLFQQQGIATARFANVESQAELEQAVAAIGLPAILKTRRLGYDGKGQLRLHDPEQVAGAFAALGEVPCLLEGFVEFASEVSLIAVRGLNGEFRAWPLVANQHDNGILVQSTPVPDHPLQARAEEHGRRILEQLNYVGVLALEFFVVDGELVANEMAPRVHNSGHWTIEGARCSQFENHLRAIAGLPLGDPSLREPTALLNLIGQLPPRAELLALPGAHLHDYDKAPAPGRKLGHLTLCQPDQQALAASLAQARRLLAAAPPA